MLHFALVWLAMVGVAAIGLCRLNLEKHDA
jgi:hypothetical protein